MYHAGLAADRSRGFSPRTPAMAAAVTVGWMIAMPFEARILKVADIYEELAAGRFRRDGLPAEKIQGIMSELLG